MSSKTVAVIEEDLKTGALGLPSVAREDLGGRPVFRRVVENLLAFARIDSVAILCPPEARGELAPMLEGLSVTFHQRAPDHPYRPMWRRGRKWALSSWRGGLGNVSVFDEWGLPRDYRRVLGETGARIVVKPCTLNPLLDGALIDLLLDEAAKKEQPVVYAQAPPGSCFEVYEAPFLDELIQKNATTREIIALCLDRTNRDVVLTDAFPRLDEKIVEGRFRVSADTRRGLDIVREIFAAVEPGEKGYPTAELQEWLYRHPGVWRRRLPREVEIELTGRDDLPSPQRPRPRAGLRDMPFELFERAVTELACYDDVVITLGGHGEPLLHPDLLRMVRRAKEAGIWGVHVETNGTLLTPDVSRALLEAGVDCVSVRVDAERPEVYRELNGADLLDQARANVEELIRISAARSPDSAYVVPEMVKRVETDDDLEPFFDRWYRKTGWAAIRPFNDFCGQTPDRTVLPLYFSRRSLCQKIANSLAIHCDGKVPVCAQDYLARWPAGEISETSLEEIWTGPTLSDLAAAHLDGRFDAFPLCPACRYWQAV
ncbi:MAG: radical SAM protein [Planctomycetes bacterium]|nr:radical SAM protein [Planctomycetota bacterium]